MYISGLYNGVKYKWIDFNDGVTSDGHVSPPPGSIVETIDDYFDLMTSANYQSAIVCAYMIPRDFVPSNIMTVAPTPSLPITKYHNFAKPIPGDYIGDIVGGTRYAPKNNKLYTYPYNYLLVDTGENCKAYRYEWFRDINNCKFGVSGTIGGNPEFMCAPFNYNGSIQTNDSEPYFYFANFTEGIPLTGFPQCAYTVDAYLAYIAQKSNKDVIQGGRALTTTLAGLGAMGFGLIGGNPLMITAGAVGATQGAFNVIDQLNDSHIDMTQGSKVIGNVGQDVLAGHRIRTYIFKKMSLRQEELVRLDDYFDRFGYAINQMAVPNRSNRPYWNYLKTKDVEIEASIPVDDLAKIKSIYNNGITFWKNGDDVGNYTRDNRPAH